MYIKKSFPFATMGEVHRYVHSHTYAHINTPHIQTNIRGKRHAICSHLQVCYSTITILQLRMKMLRIADNIQVKKPEYPVYGVHQKMVTLITSW